MLNKEQTDVLNYIKIYGFLEADYQNSFGFYLGNDYAPSDSTIKELVKDKYIILKDSKYYATNLFEEKNTPQITISYDKVFRVFSKRKDLLKAIASKYAPHILGKQTEKLAVLLSLISDSDATNRNRIHVLLKGIPGDGKTSILYWAYKNLYGNFSDSNSTKNGLRGSTLGYMYKEGLLQKSNHSVAYIDEIDKYAPEELDACLSAMETGKVFINMGKVNMETEANTRIIATCNNEARLRKEMLSRFDLIITTKSLDEEEIEKVIENKTDKWNQDIEQEDSNFIIDYIKYVRKFASKLPKDKSSIIKLIQSERKTGALVGRDIRKIESVLRLSVALAKLKLKEVVTTEEVKEALELIRVSR